MNNLRQELRVEVRLDIKAFISAPTMTNLFGGKAQHATEITRGSRSRPIQIELSMSAKKPLILPSRHDMKEAIEHADTYGDKAWTLDDFTLKFEGILAPEKLDKFDSMDWLDVSAGDFKGLSVAERLKELSSFRGPQWLSMAKHWLVEGIPPIIVITAPSEDAEDALYTQIGDGRGRINFATAMGMKLPVWHMVFKR